MPCILNISCMRSRYLPSPLLLHLLTLSLVTSFFYYPLLFLSPFLSLPFHFLTISCLSYPILPLLSLSPSSLPLPFSSLLLAPNTSVWREWKRQLNRLSAHVNESSRLEEGREKKKHSAGEGGERRRRRGSRRRRRRRMRRKKNDALRAASPSQASAYEWF